MDEVESLKYLGGVVTDQGFKPEVQCTNAQTRAAPAILKIIRNDKSMSFSSKIRLMHSLVVSMLLYAYET